MKWLIIMTLFIPAQGYFYGIYESMLDKLGYDVCNDNVFFPDFARLRANLKSMLFGQDIIIERLIPILESHYNLEPKKALVICMHGWTGSGKNYVTKLITDALFKQKSDSKFIRMFNGRIHFPLDIKEYVDQYKLNIQDWVRGNVTKCPRSVFVFDEVDKMPSGIIDAVKPFFDYHENIDSVDFRKSIFIFISNIGAEVINSRYMELWRLGKSRTDMQYKDFEPYLRKDLYKAKGGFAGSSVLEDHLVSLYLPFLPLRKKQVELCIKAELERQKVTSQSEKVISSILEEMEFNADGFSTSGCKRVSDFVATMKYRLKYEEL